MEKYYQKEINLGKMFKTLAKKWLVLVLTFLIALVACAGVGFVTSTFNKVYGVDLDYHVYKVSNVDEKGNTIIGATTEYDETTMNMVYQTLNSQGFIESIICTDQINNAEGVTDALMLDAIKTAKEKIQALDLAREELVDKQRAYSRSTKLSEKASSAFELERLGYEAVCLEYSNALQSGTVDLTEGSVFMNRLNEQKRQYDEAKTYYNATVKAAINAENEYEDCLQEIIDLTKEVNEAKSDVISLKRKQASYNEDVKKIMDSIKVSFADGNGQSKSTIRVSVAVNKKIDNSEEFAKKLTEMIKEELPNYVTDKIDFATANCDLVNVLDEVKNINQRKVIKNTVLFGVLGGVIAVIVASAVVLLKRKKEFVEIVSYNESDN